MGVLLIVLYKNKPYNTQNKSYLKIDLGNHSLDWIPKRTHKSPIQWLIGINIALYDPQPVPYVPCQLHEVQQYVK